MAGPFWLLNGDPLFEPAVLDRLFVGWDWGLAARLLSYPFVHISVTHALFAVALVSVALANRNIVTLQVLPTEISGWFAVNPSVQLPLFIVILGGIIVGLLVGFVWEWIREHKHRSSSREN